MNGWTHISHTTHTQHMHTHNTCTHTTHAHTHAHTPHTHTHTYTTHISHTTHTTHTCTHSEQCSSIIFQILRNFLWPTHHSIKNSKTVQVSNRSPQLVQPSTIGLSYDDCKVQSPLQNLTVQISRTSTKFQH